MASKKTRRRARARPVPAPQKPPPSRSAAVTSPRVLGAAALIAAAALAVILVTRGGPNQTASAGHLPDTPDYHSLLVSPASPKQLTLGTHYGLYRSADGGHSWHPAGLASSDAMNLVRTEQSTLWLAGHNVLKKSTDAGRSWKDVRPAGLPGLDVHGFGANPQRPTQLYAAIAGQGLYRSTDGGRSFATVSRSVGPAVMGLAVTPSGTLFAADMQRGLVASKDGGASWQQRLAVQALGVAVAPGDPKRILATADGIYLSTDGGQAFRRVQELSSGAGPVAWAPSNSRIAYVVGYDRKLYVSKNGGSIWSVVG